MTFFDILIFIYINKKYMKTLHIDDKTHDILKNYCKKNGYQINKLAEIIICEFIENKNKKK